jgi:hypothetical protein
VEYEGLENFFADQALRKQKAKDTRQTKLSMTSAPTPFQNPPVLSKIGQQRL